MLNTDSGSLGFKADLLLYVMLHQGIRSSYYCFASANAASLPSLSKSALTLIAIHKIIRIESQQAAQSQDVVEEVKQEHGSLVSCPEH